MTAYETARAWLAFLIDHPDKTVTVAEYRAILEEAQEGVRVAYVAWMGVGV